MSLTELIKLPVLVADDDEIACRSTCLMLDELGLHSEGVLSGEEAVERTFAAHSRREDYFAVILDWKMPGMDGIETAREIRRRVGPEVPIIILSGYDWSDCEMEARAAGVDAFITKPYNTAILLAKISALLRRAYASDGQEVLTCHDVCLHLEGSFVEHDGQRAELTKNEVKILYYLFSHAGTICSRNDMIDFLWDSRLYVDDNALSVNITRIREKLSGIGVTDFIKTKHRQGYLLS